MFIINFLLSLFKRTSLENFAKKVFFRSCESHKITDEQVTDIRLFYKKISSFSVKMFLEHPYIYTEIRTRLKTLYKQMKHGQNIHNIGTGILNLKSYFELIDSIK